MAITIIMGRDGMGPDATEEDFQNWTAYAAEHLPARIGQRVEVETKGPRDVQDTIVRGVDIYERNAIQHAIQDLWNDWCAEGAPS